MDASAAQATRQFMSTQLKHLADVNRQSGQHRRRVALAWLQHTLGVVIILLRKILKQGVLTGDNADS
jgi:hypothetical protein